MNPSLPPRSSSEPWIRVAILCACLIGGRLAIRSMNRADNPTGSSQFDRAKGPQLPTTLVDCPRPFRPDDFARLQTGMTSAMVLQSLGFEASSAGFAQQTQFPHYLLRFLASDGQIIEAEFRKGALKQKQFFVSEAARQEDLANTLWLR